MFLIIQKDLQPIIALEFVIYRRSRNTLFSLVLTNTKFLDFTNTTVKFAKAFEQNYNYAFIEVNTEDLNPDRKGSHFLLGASLKTCKRHVPVVKTILRCLASVKFDQDETTELFGAPHLDWKTLVSSRNVVTVFLFRTV